MPPMKTSLDFGEVVMPDRLFDTEIGRRLYGQSVNMRGCGLSDQGTPRKLQNSGDVEGIHRPEIDEDISVQGLLGGMHLDTAVQDHKGVKGAN